MIDFGYWSTKRIAALILLMSFVAMAVGLESFWSRRGVTGGVGPVYERAAFIISVVLTVIAVNLLEGPLVEANAANLARIAATTYLIAGPVLLVAEILALDRGGRSIDFLFVSYVFLALIAQAVLGGALIKSRLVLQQDFRRKR